jgi:Arc/MetJ-type ribon-helix-helix transcriptional regulator
MDPNIQLSEQSEEFLRHAVASGVYASRVAALEDAVAALREKLDRIPMVPPEHMALVEAALESSAAGHSRPMTADDWARLHEIAEEAAKRQK